MATNKCPHCGEPLRVGQDKCYACGQNVRSRGYRVKQTVNPLVLIIAGAVALLAVAAGIITFTLGLVIWLLMPLYDTSTPAGRRGRNATYFGLFVVVMLVVTTFWGYAALK